MSLTVGTHLGPYEILELLGKGGMGEVYRARDTRLQRDVAIKVSADRFSERFEREARAVAALNHPNIGTLHDVGPNYLVMEFVDGKALRGPLPTGEALRYANQICDALHLAHRKGIVHRDLKPANILITSHGAKLLDFGLAQMNAGIDRTQLQITLPGEVMGTPAYMAPEQWEGRLVDSRSDIYAFGCVLYEMLTGRLAASDRAPLESAQLESIVKTCLEKDPDDRWQSARDIQRALALVSADSPTTSRSPARSYWKWIAAAAVIVLAAFGVWALSRRPSGAAEKTQAYKSFIAVPANGAIASAFSNSLALSSDGTMGAFVVESDRKTGVWVRELKGTEIARYRDRKAQSSFCFLPIANPSYFEQTTVCFATI